MKTASIGLKGMDPKALAIRYRARLKMLKDMGHEVQLSDDEDAMADASPREEDAGGRPPDKESSFVPCSPVDPRCDPDRFSSLGTRLRTGQRPNHCASFTVCWTSYEIDLQTWLQFRSKNFGAPRPPVDCETTDFANYISRALDGGVGFAVTTAEETCA